MLDVEQIARINGISVFLVCRGLINLIDRGLVQPEGCTSDAAIVELRNRMAAEQA
jgi:hypothetical protein